MHDETSPRYAGWRVVLACFLLALSIFGFALYGQGIYLVELQRLNGWPASLISGAITLSLLIGNVIVIFTDEIVARLGEAPRACGSQTCRVDGAAHVRIRAVTLCSIRADVARLGRHGRSSSRRWWARGS
jgi:hypothetical protein